MHVKIESCHGFGQLSIAEATLWLDSNNMIIIGTTENLL